MSHYHVPGSTDDTDTSRSDDQRSTLSEYLIDVEQTGIDDIEFEYARPFHIAVAQKLIYKDGSPLHVASLQRERVYTERISVFYLWRSEHTYILLIRNGEKGDGGRTYYIAQDDDVVDEISRLVEQNGFEISAMESDWLMENLPGKITRLFEESDNDDAS